MNTKNLPAKLLAILAVLFAASIICTTMPALDPVRYVEADATGTAIAPALYPTIAYNENVLPEQQRIEREEITETTRNVHHWQRVTDQAKAMAKVIGWGAFALSCVGVGIFVGGWGAARGVREIRIAALPQTRRLLEGPHITPWGITHTATMATALLDEPRDALPEHARLVTATYEAMPQNALIELMAAVAGGTATRAQRAQARHIFSNSDTKNLLT